MTVDRSPAPTRRTPSQVMLAFLGEFMLDAGAPPNLRTRVFLESLEPAGLPEATMRSTLARLTARDLLAQSRLGRETAYGLTAASRMVLQEAQQRVRAADPFAPQGDGWSLVTFSLPAEDQRTRHRLRAILTWHGFAAFGRGTWVAPGEADFAALRAALAENLPTEPVIAFRASTVEGFAMQEMVQRTWNIAAIKRRHDAFIDTWASVPTRFTGAHPIAARTLLVADWLGLLRHDPRLPTQYLTTDWPAQRSNALYHSWQDQLRDLSDQHFAALLG